MTETPLGERVLRDAARGRSSLDACRPRKNIHGHVYKILIFHSACSSRGHLGLNGRLKVSEGWSARSAQLAQASLFAPVKPISALSIHTRRQSKMSSTLTETSAAAGPSGRPAASSSKQIPIVLSTTLAGLHIPRQPYLVPTSWRRTHLSSLVNRLLNDDQQNRTNGDVLAAPTASASIPFDFIVRSTGEILRSSVQDWLDANGRTEEETLELEYIRSTLPPRFTAAFQQDDWISCVDASKDG